MIRNVVIFASRPKRPSAKTAPRRGHDVPAGSTSLPLLVKLLSPVVHLLPRRRRPEGPVPGIREQRLTCLCLAGIHASQVDFMVAASRLRADRNTVVEGKRVPVRLDSVGRHNLQKTTSNNYNDCYIYPCALSNQ